MRVPGSFWEIKYQGIYNITVLYLSLHNFKKYSRSVSVWVNIRSWGWLDCSFNVCVFMVLSLEGPGLNLFVLTVQMCQERSSFLFTLRINISWVVFFYLFFFFLMLLLNFEWGVHGDYNHKWVSLKQGTESLRLLCTGLLTYIVCQAKCYYKHPLCDGWQSIWISFIGDASNGNVLGCKVLRQENG